MSTKENLENTDGEKRLQELQQRRDTKEIGETDFNTNTLRWLVEYDEPLNRRDLEKEGNAALVMTHEEFKDIGPFDIVLATGKRVTLDPDDFPIDDILVIYPKDLGNIGAGTLV